MCVNTNVMVSCSPTFLPNAGTDSCRCFGRCQHGLLKGILVNGQDFGRVCGRGYVRMRGLTSTHGMVIGREPEELPYSVKPEST